MPGLPTKANEGGSENGPQSRAGRARRGVDTMTGTQRLTSPADRVSVAPVQMEPHGGPSVANPTSHPSKAPSWGSTATAATSQNHQNREEAS